MDSRGIMCFVFAPNKVKYLCIMVKQLYMHFINAYKKQVNFKS